MATKKISEFTTLGSLSNADILPVVSGGVNKKVTATVVKNYITANTSLLDFGITDGTNGQVLTTDGAGNLTFTTVSGGIGGNPFDQDLNTTNDVTFNSASIGSITDTGSITSNGLEIYTNNGSSGSIDIYTDWNGNGTTGGLDLWLVHGDGIYLKTDDGNWVWKFDNTGKLHMPEGGDIVNVAGNSVLYGGGITLPADAVGYLTNDGSGNLTWAAGDGAFSGNYNDLTNKPMIPTSTSDLTNDSGFITAVDLPSVPTNLSQLTNDAGYITTWGQADWNEQFNENPSYILNKPMIPSSLSDFGITAGSEGQVLTLNSSLTPVWATSSGSGATTLSGLNDVGLDVPAEGQVLTWNNTQSYWENRDVPTASQIINTDGVSTFSVSVGTDGVITMNTARGGIEFGAMPEVGAPNHLHIMRPAGQGGATDLYFGDDYNYVRLPGLYGPGTQGVEIGSSFNNGPLSTWRFGTDGHIVPGFDNLQDIGSPTARVRHIYVGPGSITIGDSVLSESATGKLVVPGVTRATALHANEVEDTGDQTYQFVGLPNLLDNIEFMNRNGQYSPSGSYVPAVYQADSLDGEGYVDGISVVSGGTWTQAEADSARNNQMWATTNPDPYTSWNASDWFQIPFVVRARADDVEYEFSTGSGNTGDLQFDGNRMYADNGDNELVVDGTDIGVSLLSQDYAQLNYSSTGEVNSGNGKSSYVWVEASTATIQLYADSDNGDYNRQWVFDTAGNLTLPAGGDIKDSNGNSVLGGGSGNTNSLVNGDHTVTLESDGTLTLPGNIVAAQSGFGFNSTINNIYLSGTDVYVTLADSVFPAPVTGEVVISGVTGMTEANGTWGYEATDPGEFRIYTDSSRATLVDGSSWGSYASGGTAVAGTSNDLGITVGSKQWAFNTSGDLVLPAGGDIKDSNGNSVLGGSSSTPGISNGTFSTLPSFLDFYSGTSLRAGQNENGVFFSGDADGDPMGPGSGIVSYPIRTNFTISGTTKVVVTLDMVVNAGCSDFGLCVFEDGTQPKWAWGNNSTRIAAQYNCQFPLIHGITGSSDPESYELSGNGTYRVRFTYQPGVNPDVRLETLDTNDNVLDTVEYAETLNTSNSYRIGFAADQDSENKRTYIKNLTINVGDGQELYTNSLQLAGASDTTKTWTNPNGNTWRIEEYSGGWSGGYNYPSASISYTVTESQTDVNYFAIDTAASPTEWQSVQWATNFTINGQTIGYGGYGFAGGSTYNVSLNSNVTYNVGDVITINYGDQNQNPVPAVWWDADNSPSGNNNFRGAIIEYHAYTDAGTAIGKIIISADDQDNVTHMESMSGGSDMSQYEFWYAPGYGQLAVRRIGTDANNNDNSIMIQWTGKIFYGNEYWC